MSENILSVQNLHTSFHTDKGEVKAVNGVTFNLEKGKILGIVGESGSGKTDAGVPWKMLFYYFPGSHDKLKSGIYGGQPVKGSH